LSEVYSHWSTNGRVADLPADEHAQAQTEYNNGVTARTIYQQKNTALNFARGELSEKQKDAHQAAIGVYGKCKRRYSTFALTVVWFGP